MRFPAIRIHSFLPLAIMLTFISLFCGRASVAQTDHLTLKSQHDLNEMVQNIEREGWKLRFVEPSAELKVLPSEIQFMSAELFSPGSNILFKYKVRRVNERFDISIEARRTGPAAGYTIIDKDYSLYLKKDPKELEKVFSRSLETARTSIADSKKFGSGAISDAVLAKTITTALWASLYALKADPMILMPDLSL